jgi:hypothetical protein
MGRPEGVETMSDSNESLTHRMIDAALRAEYEAIWGQAPEVEGNTDLYFQSPERRRVAGLVVEAIWQALMCRLMSDESAGGAPSVPGGAGATNVEALVKILDMREWWEGDVYTLARHLDGQGVAAALAVGGTPPTMAAMVEAASQEHARQIDEFNCPVRSIRPTVMQAALRAGGGEAPRGPGAEPSEALTALWDAINDSNHPTLLAERLQAYLRAVDAVPGEHPQPGRGRNERPKVE